MSKLGRIGQWGNQIFQYAFLRTIAKRCQVPYQCPPWAGQVFFGHQDPPVTANLPSKHESFAPCSYEACFGVPIPPCGNEFCHCDYDGWAQFHTSWYAPDKEFIQGLYCAPEATKVKYGPLISSLRDRGDTIVSLHLRRGDAGRMIYFLTPIIWCLEWLETNLQRFTRPVLFLATEDASLKQWFTRYGVITADDLGVKFLPIAPDKYTFPWQRQLAFSRQMTFFPDWYVLQNADVVVAAESTFSVSAAWVNRSLREFWRPRLSLKGFEQCDIWNTEVSPREHLNDFPGIPGTQIDANPLYHSHWRSYKPKHPSVQETPHTIAAWITGHATQSVCGVAKCE